MSQPGDVLAERWRLIEKIDAGAMGEIFRGAHHLLGHDVAIKVLMPGIAKDQEAVERFLREAQIAAKLSNPHVVRVEDYGVSADGRPFLVMELLRGESLARRMERTEKVPREEVLEVVKQIGVGLDAAHLAGIVHRDLKPENVFLVTDPNGRMLVKVLDFGVAKFTDGLAVGGRATATNTLVGTPRYMSPEQARSSRELDGRSDLWALGIMTYEMLLGRHPFEGEAIAELLVAILTHRIAGPTSIDPELPSELDGFMGRALARNRAERYATAGEFCKALTQALSGAPGEGRRARVGTPRVTRVSLGPEPEKPLGPLGQRGEQNPKGARGQRGERSATPRVISAPPLLRSAESTALQTLPLFAHATSPSAPPFAAVPSVVQAPRGLRASLGDGVSTEGILSGRVAREGGDQGAPRRVLPGLMAALLAVVLAVLLAGGQTTTAPSPRPMEFVPKAGAPATVVAGTPVGTASDDRSGGAVVERVPSVRSLGESGTVVPETRARGEAPRGHRRLRVRGSEAGVQRSVVQGQGARTGEYDPPAI